MRGRKAGRSVVTIGTFDGIHIGHRALLKAAYEKAKSLGHPSVAYTFLKPPQNYLQNPKRLLMPPAKKLELLKSFADFVEVADFPSIRPLSAEAFVKEILVGRLKATAVVVGADFRFGHDRQGDASKLKQLGPQLGFEAEIVEPVMIQGKPVSSTATRKALADGDIALATQLLGEPHRLWGHVVPGEGQAAQLGYPTANLAMDNEVLVPMSGIYAAQVPIDGKAKPSALYIGSRPTFNGRQTSIEVHILDETLNLYEQEVSVRLFQRIRGDQRFESELRLKEQIERDIRAIKQYFVGGHANLS